MSDFRSSFDDEDPELAEFAEAQNAQDLVAVDPGARPLTVDRAVEALADGHEDAADVGIRAESHRLHQW